MSKAFVRSKAVGCGCASRTAAKAFERVFLDMGAPTWPNGFDVAPDWLWREMEAAGELTHEEAAK